jgi:hypothetical protein
MLTQRFQAWRIDPRRAGEFTRRRRPKEGAALTVRDLQREWTCGDVDTLQLFRFATGRRKKFSAKRERRRPPARVGQSCSPYREGALRCVPGSQNPIPLYFVTLRHPARHAGEPPCSLAAHRLRAHGYAAIPF